MPANNKQEYKTLRDLAQITALFKNPKIEERGVSEISKILGMQPSKVSRMIRTMETDGFFEKNPDTGKYRLGIEFFRLGVAYSQHSSLRKTVRPHLEVIAKEIGLSAMCAVLRNNDVIVIDQVQNSNNDLMLIRVALNIPVHATSLGKILLAYLTDEEVDTILASVDLKGFTPKTIVNPKHIKTHLQLVQKDGFAFDKEEMYMDFYSLAAPIKNKTGQVIAALGVSGEKSRFPQNKLSQLASYVREKARFISRQMGCISDDWNLDV